MRASLKQFFLITLLMLAFGIPAFAEELTGSKYFLDNPHFNHGKGMCSLCHTPNMPELNEGHVETCTNCHVGNISNHPVTRHPIDVVVKIEIPSPLPLTSDGKLVCSTCHDPHDNQGFSSMLRVEYHMLCVQCHRGY